MKISSTLMKCVNYLVTPVIWNLPLFLISILMLGGFDMLYYQHLYHEYEISDILSGYAEMNHLYRQFLSQVFFRNRYLS